VHAVFFGTGANGRVIFASLAHASARFGSVPPTGAQWRMYVLLPGCPCPSGQTVMFREVEATRIAAKIIIFQG
jgi:hypothetical protein